MGFGRKQVKTASPWQGPKRLAMAFVLIFFALAFLFWRTDNPRIEQMRLSLSEDYLPNFGAIFQPIGRLSGIVRNFSSYNDLVDENRELRRELQQLESWREAALQLEQTNAELRALNNLSVLPSNSFISGEIVADSGSSFSQSAVINVGRNKGVENGAPVLDGFGVVGRISGIGDSKSRVLLLSDPTSKISALVMPERARVVLRGDNNNQLRVTPVDAGTRLTPGARVVTSGAGIFPADLLIGYIVTDGQENATVRLAAKFGSLEFARILISPEAPNIPRETSVVVPDGFTTGDDEIDQPEAEIAEQEDATTQ